MKLNDLSVARNMKFDCGERPGPLDCGFNALIDQPAITLVTGLWKFRTEEVPGINMTSFSSDRIWPREPPAQDHGSP